MCLGLIFFWNVVDKNIADLGWQEVGSWWYFFSTRQKTRERETWNSTKTNFLNKLLVCRIHWCISYSLHFSVSGDFSVQQKICSWVIFIIEFFGKVEYNFLPYMENRVRFRSCLVAKNWVVVLKNRWTYVPFIFLNCFYDKFFSVSQLILLHVQYRFIRLLKYSADLQWSDRQLCCKNCRRKHEGFLRQKYILF
jgi:hypothetical protein